MLIPVPELRQVLSVSRASHTTHVARNLHQWVSSDMCHVTIRVLRVKWWARLIDRSAPTITTPVPRVSFVCDYTQTPQAKPHSVRHFGGAVRTTGSKLNSVLMVVDMMKMTRAAVLFHAILRSVSYGTSIAPHNQMYARSLQRTCTEQSVLLHLMDWCQ